jgi:hypothetical protein
MILYVTLNAYFSRNLWFWWDELTILTAQKSDLHGFLQNHEGNFSPLGRLFFYIETLVFGGHYFLYIVTNCVMVCSLMILLYMTLQRQTPLQSSSQILPISLVGGYALNLGIVYDSQWGFQSAWFLSIGFILIANLLHANQRMSKWILIMLLILSWLSFGSTIVTACLLFLCLLKDKFCESVPTYSLSATRYVLFSFLLLATGLLIIQFYPSVDVSAMPPPINTEVTFAHFYGVLIRMIISSLVWVMSPICLFQSQWLHNFNLFGNYFLGHSFAATILSVSFLILILLVTKMDIFSNSRLPFFAILFFASLVAIRGFGTLNSDFSIRYAPFQYIFAIIFWWGILFRLDASLNYSKIRFVFRALVLATAAISLFFSIDTLKSASDLDRRLYTKEQLHIAESCYSEGGVHLLPVVQPSVNAETFCKLFVRMRS